MSEQTDNPRKRKYTRIAGVLIVATVNAYLLFLPLTKYFSYEYSAVNAVLLFIVAGLYTSVNRKGTGADATAALSRSDGLYLLVLYGLPPLISLIRYLVVQDCSYLDGVPFYLVITLPALFIGGVLGITAVFFNKRFAPLVFLAFILIPVISSVWDFYLNPQVYFYNSIIGLFPGVIYDELIEVNGSLLGYRVFNLLIYSGVAAFVLLNKDSRRNKVILAGAALLLFAVTKFFAPRFGFATTTSVITKELTAQMETEHFTLHYDTGLDSAKAAYLAEIHELSWQELSEYFNGEPDRKVTSFVFRDRQQRKRLFGSQNADVAKPWLYQIYISEHSFESTIKHELAHVFAGEFGVTPFKVSAMINPALIEGIAVAAVPESNAYPVEHVAAAGEAYGYKPPMARLFSGLQFMAGVSTASYTYAGAFCRFLEEEYGIEKLKRVYATGDFAEVYGMPVDTLDALFTQSLRDVPGTRDSAMADYYFGRVSLLSKSCPRYTAGILRDAFSIYYNGEYETALEAFEDAAAITGSYSVVYGKTNSLMKLERFDDAAAYLQGERERFEGSAYYYPLMFKLADAEVLAGREDSARVIYEQLRDAKPTWDYLILPNFRLALMQDSSAINDYLTSSDSAGYEIASKVYEATGTVSAVPVLLRLHERAGVPYERFMLLFERFEAANTVIDGYALALLARTAFRYSDLENADRFTAMLAANTQPELGFLKQELTRRLKWFRLLKKD